MTGRIEAALAGWGLSPDRSRFEMLERYRADLEVWNRKVGLVARGEDLTDHILDSLRGLPILENLPGTLIADAGSGGGLPGIPLAVFQPRRRFVLVERSARKAGFLRYAAAAAGLDNVEVADLGLEEVDLRFDGVVFRALGELKRYIDILIDITVPGGWLLGYKGRCETAEAELKELDVTGASARIVRAPPIAPGGAETASWDRSDEKERTFLIVRKG